MDEVRNSESSEWVVFENDKQEIECEEQQALLCETNSANIVDDDSDLLEHSVENLESEGGPSLSEYGIEDIEFEDSDPHMFEDPYICIDAVSELISISKGQCYKHNRNDRLNFILNLILALVVATAVGFGSGHFLGWSHKCQYDVQDDHIEVFDSAEEQEKNLKEYTLKKLVMSEGKKIQMISVDTSFPQIVTIDPSKVNETDRTYLKQENDNYVSETSVFSTLVISETKKTDNSSLENTNTHGSKIPENTNWDHISNTVISKESEIEDSHLFERIRENERYAEFELLKELQVDVKHVFDKNDSLIDNLRHDFNYIIQSLNIVALASVSQAPDVEYESLKIKLEFVKHIYDKFQSIIDEKLSKLENLIKNSSYETVRKSDKKLLQKMYFSLINSVEYFLKSSIKTFKKDFKYVKIEKFHRWMIKSIEDLNRKWEKFEERWAMHAENVNNRHIDERSHKKSAKYWKKKKFYSNEDVHRNKYFNQKSREILMEA